MKKDFNYVEAFIFSIVIFIVIVLLFTIFISKHPDIAFMPYNAVLPECEVYVLNDTKYNIFPEAIYLENRFDEIKTEVTALLDNIKNNAREQDCNVGEFFLPAKDKEFWENWNLIPLRLYGVDIEETMSLCPSIRESLNNTMDKIPTIAISVLGSGKIIPPHTGPYGGILRYHLALQVPKDRNKCTIEIDNNLYSWQERESIIFDETKIHTAKNLTEEDRVVLYIDIRRNLDNMPLDLTNKMILNLIKVSPQNISAIKSVQDKFSFLPKPLNFSQDQNIDFGYI